MRACLPRKATPSSIVIRISLMPNSPITATRKSKPRSSSVEPKVIRSVPETVSMPTAASRKPAHIAIRILGLASLPMPTKLQKVSR